MSTMLAPHAKNLHMLHILEPEHAGAHYRRFLELGIQVANGKFV